MLDSSEMVTVIAPDDALGYRLPAQGELGSWIFERAQLRAALEAGIEVVRTYDDPDTGTLLCDVPGLAPLGQLASLEADVERLFQLWHGGPRHGLPE